MKQKDNLDPERHDPDGDVRFALQVTLIILALWCVVWTAIKFDWI